VPEQAPWQLTKRIEHLAIAPCSPVHEGLDCQLNLFGSRARSQDISCEPEIAIAAYGEDQAQPPGQTVSTDSELRERPNFVVSPYQVFSFSFSLTLATFFGAGPVPQSSIIFAS
jgi:hypothetical protein